ncbi:hypothetical protein VTI74DRAFT_7302 [Chaetomium olivicolor]
MVDSSSEPSSTNRAESARNLISLLETLLEDDQASNTRDILSGIESLLLTLTPWQPLYAAFHDGQVHDPLGGGAYAFREDLIEPLLFELAHEEVLTPQDGPGQPHERRVCGLPTRPIIIHAGAQPNNSPHCGTLIVFCYAFALARAIRDRMQAKAAATKPDTSEWKPPPVSVEITFIDTAPVSSEGLEIDGIHYQKSYRDVPGALAQRMSDYEEILGLLSAWSDIPCTTAFQSDFFSHPSMPDLVRYLVANHRVLGRQLSPKYGALALRAACPAPGCGLAEKHGRLNRYEGIDTDNPTIVFHCPRHGEHSMTVPSSSSSFPSKSPPSCPSLQEPETNLSRLEANALARNLLRSMLHLSDRATHHVRVTGADYAGTYQEAFLYRPLPAWSASTTTTSAIGGDAAASTARGRTPHIFYAPLVVDWSGAKLSKSLYVREGGYATMGLLGTEGLAGYDRLKAGCCSRGDVHGGGDGNEGLKRVWEEVCRWVADPRRLFRCFFVEYLKRVVIEGRPCGEADGEE